MHVNSNATKTTEEQQEALKAQKAALEGLVVNNVDLEKLEIDLANYNIFEAIGMVSQEPRHSAFLAFLLNPAGNHGLGDWFLKSFLKKAVAAASGQKELVSPIYVGNDEDWETIKPELDSFFPAVEAGWRTRREQADQEEIEQVMESTASDQGS